MSGSIIPWWRNLWCMQQTIPYSLDTATLSALEILNKIVFAVNNFTSDMQKLTEQLDAAMKELEQLESDVTNLEKEVDEKYFYLLSLINELKKLVEMIKASELQWDCQHGIYTDSMTAQRDMFNDITVHGITCEDMLDYVPTVDALASCGLNVRGLAVMGFWLVNHFDIPDYFTRTTPPEGKRTLTPIDLSESYVNEKGYVMV